MFCTEQTFLFSGCSKSIKSALLEVTGTNYKLGLFKCTSEQSAPKRDPLEDLINQASGSINIEYE